MAYRRDTKKRIIFFGDSITEQGKLLNGFISLINRKIEVEELIKKYQTIVSGKSGNRIYDLHFRIESDVLAKSPNIVIVNIGTNDVSGKILTGTGLDIERFENFYRSIIVKLLAANSKIILCTPALIGEKKNNSNLQDEDLNMYCEVVRKLSKEYALFLCDLRETFIYQLSETNYENLESGIFTTDGVHLNDEGNRIVANRLWDIIKQIK